MIELANKPAGQRWLEIGCGDRPNPHCDVHVDKRNIPGVTHFVVDLEQTPYEISDADFDGIVAQYVLEHVSWRLLPACLKECFRILKPGGRMVASVPNTEAQVNFIRANPMGWDDRDDFRSFSGVLFGDQDYPDNCHKAYLSPAIVTRLFREAGFERVVVSPYGARNTDMVVDAVKSLDAVVSKPPATTNVPVSETSPREEAKVSQKTKVYAPLDTTEQRSEAFGRDYFNGGGKWGGYLGTGFADFPVHEVVFRKIVAMKPESVLEIGAARGHIVKRLVDHGIRAKGLEISRHCLATRACKELQQWDICTFPWPCADKEFDLCMSTAVLEHIPEKFLPRVFAEMHRVSRRGIHGVDFGANDDGQDKTHVSLHDPSWWKQFDTRTQELVDKEVLVSGPFPREVIEGDGKVKFALGTFTVMSHHGWINVDVADLDQFARSQGYRFVRHDIRTGIPATTGSVDLIHTSHCIEHLSYRDAIGLFRDMRRAVKPNAVIRIAVPDASLLIKHYCEGGDFRKYAEINEVCGSTQPDLVKLHALTCEQHLSLWDKSTLGTYLSEAGFVPYAVGFRETVCGDAGQQILCETLDMFPDLSCYVEATPAK